LGDLYSVFIWGESLLVGGPGEILFWLLRLQKIFILFFVLENCDQFLFGLDRLENFGFWLDG
jgi:hypothetical protein